MKKWKIIRILGLVMALGLITFGSLDNILRSLKLVVGKFRRGGK